MPPPTPLPLELTSRLPSPKGIALAIMNTCRRDDVTVQDVSRLVQSDPALTGRLLQQANAAGHSGRPLASVPDAVGRIGLRAVRQLALGFSLIDQHGKGACQGFDYGLFWSHSLMMALAAQEFGTRLRLAAPDELFSCGLMARVGRLALATAHPGEYSKVLAEPRYAGQPLVLEREHLGIDSVELTAALLIDWGFPQALVDPLKYLETPRDCPWAAESRPSQLMQLLVLARMLADYAVAAQDGRAALVPGLVASAALLGLTEADLDELIDTLAPQWRSWGTTLQVPAGQLPRFDTVGGASSSPGVLTREPAPAQRQVRVMLVTDDAQRAEWLRQAMASEYTITPATDLAQAMALAVSVRPQLLIADNTAHLDGMRLCRDLRQSQWGQGIYILLLTDHDDEAHLDALLEAGADGHLHKPLQLPALSARLKAAARYLRLRQDGEENHAKVQAMAAELAISNRRLQEVALTDDLTQIANRRAGAAAAATAWGAARRQHLPLSMISIDLDHFKAVNDRHGHASGDLVLKAVAQALRAVVRQEDMLCRWGGEEFLVVSLNVPLRDAVQAATRYRDAVRELRIRIGTVTLAPTISLGVATMDGTTPDLDHLLSAADKALYAAKAAGRDRVALQPVAALQRA
jgi:diguanylate cyclase (GGDEF)-like protein